MKSIYLIQKYPHSIELYGCILFLFSMSFIISFGISLTQGMLYFQQSNTMLSNELLLIHTDPDLLHMPHPLF